MFFTSKPCLVAVSGISGTGKTTLIANLESQFLGCRVITHTSRLPRNGETVLDYNFCNLEEIENLPDALWVKESYGNKYAVTKSSICKIIDTLGIAILPTLSTHHSELLSFSHEINCNYLGIHLAAPNSEELTKRLTKRGQNSDEIRVRLSQIQSIEQKVLAQKVVTIIEPASEEEVLKSVLQLIKGK